MKAISLVLLVFLSLVSHTCEYSHDPMAEALNNLIKQKKLRLETIMEQLKSGEVKLESLPFSFFSYQTDENFSCSKNISSCAFTPLMYIILHANDDYFFSLLENSKISERLLKTVNMQNKARWAALHFAAQNLESPRNLALLKILEKAGADFNLCTKKGWTALHVAARHAPKSYAMLRFLSRKSNVNIKTRYGNSALMLALNSIEGPDSLEHIYILIDEGTDISITNHEGEDALYIAANIADKYFLNSIQKEKLLRRLNINLIHSGEHISLLR